MMKSIDIPNGATIGWIPGDPNRYKVGEIVYVKDVLPFTFLYEHIDVEIRTNGNHTRLQIMEVTPCAFRDYLQEFPNLATVDHWRAFGFEQLSDLIHKIGIDHYDNNTPGFEVKVSRLLTNYPVKVIDPFEGCIVRIANEGGA